MSDLESVKATLRKVGEWKGGDDWYKQTCRDALAVIEAQEKEIARLNETLSGRTFFDRDEEIARLKARLAECELLKETE